MERDALQARIADLETERMQRRNPNLRRWIKRARRLAGA